MSHISIQLSIIFSIKNLHRSLPTTSLAPSSFTCVCQVNAYVIRRRKYSTRSWRTLHQQWYAKCTVVVIIISNCVYVKLNNNKKVVFNDKSSVSHFIPLSCLSFHLLANIILIWPCLHIFLQSFLLLFPLFAFHPLLPSLSSVFFLCPIVFIWMSCVIFILYVKEE